MRRGGLKLGLESRARTDSVLLLLLHEKSDKFVYILIRCHDNYICRCVFAALCLLILYNRKGAVRSADQQQIKQNVHHNETNR
jgi:hypothetical protein